MDDSPKVVHGCPAPFWNQAEVYSFVTESGDFAEAKRFYESSEALMWPAVG